MQRERTRRIPRFLSGVLLLATLFAGVRADASAMLSFVPVTTEVSCDQIKPIDIWVDAEGVDLRGASLVLTFDPNVMTSVAVEEGQLFLDAPCPSFLRWNNSAAIGDSIYVDVAGLGCSVEGPGPIVRLWVTGVADGATLLTPRSAILRDSANQPIPTLWTPGHVIVACAVPVVDRSWATLKSSFR